MRLWRQREWGREIEDDGEEWGERDNEGAYMIILIKADFEEIRMNKVEKIFY